MSNQALTHESQAEIAPREIVTTAAGGSSAWRWFFFFFFLSGLCSVLYEVVWLRLGMAKFGVTSALISIFLSIFLAGLGVGSWLGGWLMRRLERSPRLSPLVIYAAIEALIGCSSLAVPAELAWARSILDRSDNGAGLGVGSSGYYIAAGFWLTLVLLPWCLCMGATFPAAMAALRRMAPSGSERSFSFLYLANVLGAVAGALLPAFVLVELLGFTGSLKVGFALNLLLAALVLRLVFFGKAHPIPATEGRSRRSFQVSAHAAFRILSLLFLTGLVSLALEVVWIRQFTPFMGTTIWTFAAILSLYLLATFGGSQIYRLSLRERPSYNANLAWSSIAVAGLFTAVAADPRLLMIPLTRIMLGVIPFSAVVGFLTPMLVDEFSAGDPERAGVAYAVNVIGCIIGPLLSGFILLPTFGERGSLAALCLPLAGLAYLPGRSAFKRSLSFALTGLLAVALLHFTEDFPDQFTQKLVRRDYAATVVATGRGRDSQLLVNGVGITRLTPIAKLMAHMPMAMLPHPPHNALVICFGMGTTFRSMLTWDVPVTAVDLLPSVPALFSYYHADAPAVVRSPFANIVIDDGRMFLEKTHEQFDVITIDPPPPVQAAGSSLLYSRQFYAIAKKHLRPGGILQQWYAYGDSTDIAAVTRAISSEFPYVKSYVSIEKWGAHFLASMQPLPDLSPAEMVQRTPLKAQRDLIEWGPERTPEAQYAAALHQQVAPEEFLQRDPESPALDDDAPVNEYYLLRSYPLTAKLASSFNRRRQQQQAKNIP